MANILVADDSKTMRDVIESVLTNAGHQVTTVNDGNEALVTAKKNTFDLILSDIYMPGKTGISLVASLRRLPDYESRPILLITTEDSEHMKRKSRDLGANGWLTKPIDATRLLTAVSKTLAKFDIE